MTNKLGEILEAIGYKQKKKGKESGEKIEVYEIKFRWKRYDG